MMEYMLIAGMLVAAMVAAYFYYQHKKKPKYYRANAIAALAALYDNGISIQPLSISDHDNGAGQRVVQGGFKYKGTPHKFIMLFGAGTADIVKIAIDGKRVLYDPEKAWKYAEMNDRKKNPHKYK